jgi:hypothetical protein
VRPSISSILSIASAAGRVGRQKAASETLTRVHFMFVGKKANLFRISSFGFRTYLRKTFICKSLRQNCRCSLSYADVPLMCRDALLMCP